MGTEAGVGSEGERRARPATGMLTRTIMRAVCLILESWGRFWSLLCQAATAYCNKLIVKYRNYLKIRASLAAHW